MLLFTEATSGKKLEDKADSCEEEEAVCHFAVNTDTDKQTDRVRKSLTLFLSFPAFGLEVVKEKKAAPKKKRKKCCS